MSRRVDIFSLKGGVGKTTLAVLLARAQIAASRRPVLIVDADFTGTCLGDLLEFWATPKWHNQFNLSHLVCGRPERLMEDLKDPSRLPVYVYRPYQGSAGEGENPCRLKELPASTPATFPHAKIDGDSLPPLLFCPSHIESTDGGIDAEVLVALLGNESAGGWVRFVIDRVIDHAERLTRPAGGLGGIIVDHSPGMSSLQNAVLEDVMATDDENGGPPGRQIVFVTSRDIADLASAVRFESKFGSRLVPLTRWVVNRIDPAIASPGKDWRSEIHRRIRGKPRCLQAAWPFYEDTALAETNARAEATKANDANRVVIDEICAQLFPAETESPG